MAQPTAAEASRSLVCAFSCSRIFYPTNATTGSNRRGRFTPRSMRSVRWARKVDRNRGDSRHVLHGLCEWHAPVPCSCLRAHIGMEPPVGASRDIVAERSALYTRSYGLWEGCGMEVTSCRELEQASWLHRPFCQRDSKGLAATPKGHTCGS